MHHVITGGAGFIGANLAQRLVGRGDRVTVVDNLSTGHNLDIGEVFRNADVRTSGWINDVETPNVVWHLASPCSPPDYQKRRIETLLINAYGTESALELARLAGAKFVLASTSEIYGDPMMHPQPERYRGEVSTVGPRACYDEGKRYAEALAMSYHAEHSVDVKIARLFNTYGPMMADDGRAVIRFMTQAMRNEPIVIHGNGHQTRAFSYVADTIEGLLRFATSQHLVCNIGSDNEISVGALASEICNVVGSDSEIQHVDADVDDPRRRCPDLTLLRSLGWEPHVSLTNGLYLTYKWLQEQHG